MAKARSSVSSKPSSTGPQVEPTAPAKHTTATRRRSAERKLSICWLHPTRGRMWSSLPTVETTLGRDPKSQIVLGGTSISRQHAQILRRGAAYAVRDLASRNGVYCDGVRVTELAPLRQGSVVRLGDWVGIVTRAESAEDVKIRELAPGLVGSETLGKVVATARRAASSRLPILILGETGTGKELLARAIHGFSGRSGAFVAVNCAALPEALVESELFGHERGAFTGADRSRFGLLRRADGGTLFLDEVGELPLAAQAKLLRVLQENELLPVGGSREVKVDLRVVCATHCALATMIESGAFRSDLYARIEGLVLELPALRDRREDILPLLEYFVAQSLGAEAKRPALSAGFVERLVCRPFARNVRELFQLAERLAVLHGAEAEWGSHHLPSTPDLDAREVASVPPLRQPPLEREALLLRLEQARGNVAQAARGLGLSKQTLYTWIREHGIDLDSLRRRALEAERRAAKE